MLHGLIIRPGKIPAAARADERGFSLLETLGALAVASLILLSLTALWMRGTAEMTQNACAWHLASVTRAGLEYVRSLDTTQTQGVTQTAGLEFGIDELIEARLLPADFADTNPWNQSYSLQLRKWKVTDDTEHLYLFVLTTGGRGSDYDASDTRFTRLEAPAAARRSGPFAGYIDGEGGTYLVAGHGGWRLPLADFGLDSPGPGHLGAWARVDDTTGLYDDVLYRVAVDGHPELNQMTVILDMTDHGVTNAGFVQFTPWGSADDNRPVEAGTACNEDEIGRLFLDEENGLFLCRQVEGAGSPELVLVSDSGNSAALSGATLVTDNALVSKPVCAAANTTPRLVLAPSIASSGPMSPAMAAFRVWAEEEGEDAWRVYLKVKNVSHQNVEDWYSPTDEGEELAPYYGSAVAITFCARISSEDGQ